MRIGLVCPYSMDAPGGVQQHIGDLAEELIGRGHEVSVLAPAEPSTPVAPYVVAAGSSTPIPYNGSVARLNFSPLAASRVNRWLRAGDFDLLHLHEPMAPSLSLLALWATDRPIVATFHTSMDRSFGLRAAGAMFSPSLDKLGARVAVSEEARRTLAHHVGGTAEVIPNGVHVSHFARAEPDLRWVGTEARPTVAFLGRLDEPRKGLAVLTEAIPHVLERRPGARFLIAGRGHAVAQRRRLAPYGDSVQFLGAISEADKRSLLKSVDVYVAPHLGGESFGIVLTEAMAAGALVVASDLPAFAAVLDGGRAGHLVPAGEPRAFADRLVTAFTGSSRMRDYASESVRRYDWPVVTDRLLDVYGRVAFSP